MKRIVALLIAIAFIGAAHNADARVAVDVGIGVAPAPVVVAPPPCQQFRQDVLIGNRVRSTYYTACLQPNGAWAPVGAPSYVAPAYGGTYGYVQPAIISGAVIIGRPGWYHGRFWDGHNWRR